MRAASCHEPGNFVDRSEPMTSTSSRPPYWTLPVEGINTNSIRYEVHALAPGVDFSKVRGCILDQIDSWTKEFIWNLDEFSLSLSDDGKRLFGTMELGQDSVVCPDEWLVVGALWQASE